MCVYLVSAVLLETGKSVKSVKLQIRDGLGSKWVDLLKSEVRYSVYNTIWKYGDIGNSI